MLLCLILDDVTLTLSLTPQNVTLFNPLVISKDFLYFTQVSTDVEFVTLHLPKDTIDSHYYHVFTGT